MSEWEKKIEETLHRGGVGFWILCVVFSVGFYGALWLILAIGTIAGF
jgi:hypothetical protein